MIRIRSLCLLTALAAAVIALPTRASAAPHRAAAVVLVWSVADPASAFPDVRTMDVALRAPFEIGAVAKALGEHPSAHFGIEMTPDYLSALNAAAIDPLAAASNALDSPSDERTRDVLMLIAHLPPLDAEASASAGGRALASFAARARAVIGGVPNSRMLRNDVRRAAALDAAARLAMTGSAAARALLDAPPAQASVLSQKADALLAAAAQLMAAQLSASARAGALEIVATPNGDPVLPLLVDSGGKSAEDPTAIPLDASADAAALVSDALAAASALNKDGHAGLASPYGAYDDAAAQQIAGAGARFAVFSDRVVRASQAGGSVEALAAALAAPYQAYDLQISKTTFMPVLFWDESTSSALETIAATAPVNAFANRLAAAAQTAGNVSSDAHALIALRVRMDRQWAQRDDALAVVGAVARTVSGRDGSATPSGYIEAHQHATPVYGFAPGSSLGSLDAFDGTPNQQAMWSALAAARYAASGGAALTNQTAQALLWRAEAGTWYRVPDLPLSADAVQRQIDQFRTLLADVYKACGKTPPAKIAPQRTPPPSPAPTPAPKPSPSYPQGL